MRKVPYSHPFLIALFFSIISVVHTHAQLVETESKLFSSREGKFTVLLPGIPTTGYRPINSDSPTSVTYVTNLQTPSASYIIAYFDLPSIVSGSENAKKLIDETRDRILKMYSLKLESENEISSADYSQRALKMLTPSGKEFLTRIHLVKQRVYHVSIVLLNKDAKSSEVAAYFESFKPMPLTDEEIRNLASSSQQENDKAIPRKIKVSEAVLRNKAIKKIQPTYSAELKKAKISGVVQVRVMISEQGQVIEAEALNGPEQLRDTSVLAAKQWIFKPFVVGGYPVKVNSALTFEFK